ncbi:MAG: DUF3109 domain-containing protein [Ignavibacteria bacterium]
MAETRLQIKSFFISNELFEKGYAEGIGPCACTSRCCSSGVWVDEREHDAILQRRELIKQQMDESQSCNEQAWFDGVVEEDSDFPSGRCIGTAVVNDKCAFLDAEGRCSIQRAAVAAGEHPWAWKPLFCVLFPLVIEDSVIGFDPMLQGEEPCCSVSTAYPTPLFRACKAELTYLLGEDGYAQLEEYYASLQKARTTVTTA